jgi:hypothetical protein
MHHGSEYRCGSIVMHWEPTRHGNGELTVFLREPRSHRMPTVNVQALVQAVAEVAEETGRPIVTSREVKNWCDANGWDWGEGYPGYGGKYLDEASDAGIANGAVVKWKRGVARNAMRRMVAR